MLRTDVVCGNDGERRLVILGEDSDEPHVVGLSQALGEHGLAVTSGLSSTIHPGWVAQAVERRAIFLLVSEVEPERSPLADELRAIVDSGNYEALELPPRWRMFVPMDWMDTPWRPR